MSNTSKNVGKASSGTGKASSFLPYIAVAAVVIVVVLIFFFLLAQPKQGALPPASNLMKEESCKFVYGVVMDTQCSNNLTALAEVYSTSGTKKFCCGKSVNLKNEANASLPVAPP